MRIGIDARYLSHGLVGGVHTYVFNLIQELARLDTTDQFFLYADTKRPFELQNLPHNFTLKLLPWRNKLDSLKIDAFFSRYIAEDKLDVIHFPANYGLGPQGVATLITLHDALNIFPVWESIKRELKKPKAIAQILYLQGFTRLSGRRATRFVTVSGWSASNIAEVSRGKIPHQNIEVIHSAPAAHFRVVENIQTLEEAKRRLQLPSKFVLADGLKNPGVILRAWELLPENLRNEYRIVFFSRKPELLPIAMEAIRANKAQHLIRPKNEDLVALYNLATLFLFPSWIEGFGLPILEAMACGAPVIASDRGSIPEIGSKAAYYHDAEDEVSLARLLEQALTSPEKRKEMQTRGYKRAAEFSWRKTAEEHYFTYKKLAKIPSPALAIG
ncbi:glycosyltransferase family 1 protein [Candidatus Chlorohelix sp.]|uniref:glycosyltransferase family 4 protein n=1 Tax=Candidatus Chlorohelix sp. TaxID=3139201 RepID=UPI003045AB23